MANDNFQLTTNTAAAADFWTQGGQGTPGSQAVVPYVPPASGYTGSANGAMPQRSPVAKAHRLLRGRYPLAIFLAAAGAIAGALGGWMAMPPKYESVGLVQVNTVISSPNPGDQIVPMLTLYITGQVGLLSSTSVAEAAVQDPAFQDAWRNNYSTPIPTPAEFMLEADVEHVKAGPLISVKFDDKKKAVAEAGCHALLAAYIKQHGSGNEFLDVQQKMDYNNRDLATQENALAFKRSELDALAKKFGSVDLVAGDQQAQANVFTLQGQLDQAKIALDNAIGAASGKTAPKVIADKETLYQEIANADAVMALNLRLREAAKINFDDVKDNFGPNHPRYTQAQKKYLDSQNVVEDYSKEYLARHGGTIPFADPTLATPGYAGQSVDMLKLRVDGLTKMVDEAKQKANEIGTQRQQINDVNLEIAQIQGYRDRDLANIKALQAELSLNKPVAVVDWGDHAELASDKRKLVAGLGFGLGGIIPLGMMLLYGLTENRFRYSDDASTAQLSGVTLLGILPNLPDRLSDPQQAGVAAHCVHQIRTMLQISSATDEPQVIAVTSASSGDGKTSLTLALGLSYAAAGARTLLVDCDLVAAGLTHRLNVNSADGVLEAVANRALLEYVRTTDIADVAILPVGTTHAHHASTLSPVALRRLLSEGRKHFDIIIIDTGPILGSIEASLVCAAADRTILAVARNQQRPIVEKSISHLISIGANLAGVVFNRAHARDFERSMSGLALRSRPAAGAPGQASAANSVAGSFKRAG